MPPITLYPLSLHDALPIYRPALASRQGRPRSRQCTLPCDDQQALPGPGERLLVVARQRDRKGTRLNSSHDSTSYAVFCLKKKNIELDKESEIRFTEHGDSF